MIEELKINNKDAFATWGMVITKGSLNALKTPAPNKSYIENKSTVEHGKTVYIATTGALIDERNLKLDVSFWANSETEFDAKYNSFCKELQKGWIHIETIFQPGVIYKCTYQNCQQYSEYNGKLAKAILSLNEPNPMDRK